MLWEAPAGKFSRGEMQYQVKDQGHWHISAFNAIIKKQISYDWVKIKSQWLQALEQSCNLNSLFLQQYFASEICWIKSMYLVKISG